MDEDISLFKTKDVAEAYKTKLFEFHHETIWRPGWGPLNDNSPSAPLSFALEDIPKSKGSNQEDVVLLKGDNKLTMEKLFAAEGDNAATAWGSFPRLHPLMVFSVKFPDFVPMSTEQPDSSNCVDETSNAAEAESCDEDAVSEDPFENVNVDDVDIDPPASGLLNVAGVIMLHHITKYVVRTHSQMCICRA